MPTNLLVCDVTKNAVTLKWSEPTKDGGARVKGYVVEKKNNVSSLWKTVKRSTTDCVCKVSYNHTIKKLLCN